MVHTGKLLLLAHNFYRPNIQFRYLWTRVAKPWFQSNRRHWRELRIALAIVDGVSILSVREDVGLY